LRGKNWTSIGMVLGRPAADFVDVCEIVGWVDVVGRGIEELH